MRILHVLGSLKLPPDPDEAAASGVVRVALELAKEQVKQGHEVHVATVSLKSWKSAWHGVKLLGLPYAPWARARMAGRSVDFSAHMPYILLTQRDKFDVVQGHLYNYLRFLKARMKVIHMHADPCHHGHGTRSVAFGPSDIEIIAKFSDYQIGVSNFISKQLNQLLGSRGNIHTIHNGVDTARFAPQKHRQARIETRARWGVKESEVVVLYSGAIAPEKGVMHLAHAFSKLYQRIPGIHLVLAGSSSLWGSNLNQSATQSDYEARLLNYLNAFQSRGAVHLLGKVTAKDMPNIYAAADIFVLPSTCQEAFALSSLEAMASGLPVIASRVGGIPEVVDESSGYLIPPGDEQALESSMFKLAKDKARRQEMGKAGLEAAELFSWAATATKFNDLYKKSVEARTL